MFCYNRDTCIIKCQFFFLMSIRKTYHGYNNILKTAEPVTLVHSIAGNTVNSLEQNPSLVHGETIYRQQN